MSTKAIITDGYGSFGTVADVIRMGYGASGAVVQPTVVPVVGAGKRRKQELYALTYEGRQFVFASLQALLDWFMSIEQKQTEVVKKKPNATPNAFSGLASGRSQSLRSCPSRRRARKYARRSMSWKSTCGGNTTRLCPTPLCEMRRKTTTSYSLRASIYES